MKHHQRKGTWLEHDAGASLDVLLILATRAGLKVKIDVRSAV